MVERLHGKRVALLVADGFEQIELTEPKRALEEAGASAEIVSPADGKVKGWKHTHWGDEFDVDVALDSASESDFDALVLPGGVMNPDALRQNEKAVTFVQGFFDHHKPVAAICHGGWTLAEADVLQGRRVTSYPSIQTDLKNAGAVWVDEEVVVDDGLVTSRNPHDLPAFTTKLVEEIAESRP
ncbi:MULTISPECIES: type 1 glutamine amidotransferase domain-containing protein [unclassified Guyparkeria]|uniref:type 1 glutamine amidotransferase domain-containing protein n=1 Tax=unclassified Guyparkeria TaxID=2626246 RepID=UPI0007339B54|nr:MULTISPECIES: type 1 glutamine amidotransferase domain-containing protein [unclassified Guyparkeria]KTG16487.1 glutamine amidotransferase [Guyparkeria sp. XI15]OAE85427.1 glutamine amidotransferase [Guyparkeria sp. WRN-7]